MFWLIAFNPRSKLFSLTSLGLKPSSETLPFALSRNPYLKPSKLDKEESVMNQYELKFVTYGLEESEESIAEIASFHSPSNSQL